MATTLVRIITEDALVLHGLFYEPTKGSRKAIIHIHGWTGNFYENEFLNHIAHMCTQQGYGFLTCNTRGAGFVQEFLDDNHHSYHKVGGSLERFSDSTMDIRAMLDFLYDRGYDEVILEGHSTGCQKSVYYAATANDTRIKGVIALEPADDPAIVRNILGVTYGRAIRYAARKVSQGASNAPMPSWIPFGVALSAQRFLDIARPDSPEGSIFHVAKPGPLLHSLTRPILVVSAEHSEYQDPEPLHQMLAHTISNPTLHIVPDTGHWFIGYEQNLTTHISNWLRQIENGPDKSKAALA